MLTTAQSPDADSDLGWRVLGGAVRSEPHTEGGLYYTGRYGRLFSDLSVSRDQTALRDPAFLGWRLWSLRLDPDRRPGRGRRAPLPADHAVVRPA